MKKILTIATFAAAIAGLSSCDSFLDDNRYPLTQIPDNDGYWNNASNVEAQTNTFFEEFVGYGNAGGYGWSYFKTLSDDQAGGSFTTWHTTNVPESNSDYNNCYAVIRRANTIIAKMQTSTLTPNEKLNFEGIARLNRAREFYQLVRMFGDVTWVNIVVDPFSEDGKAILEAPRTNRDIVMDSVLNDLNFAVAAISTQKGKAVWSKDLANAIKSEICLYEGTFCKYRTAAENGAGPDLARADKYLNEAVKASEALIGSYPISDDYHAIFNSDRPTLEKNTEIIFMKPYENAVLMHSTIDYTCSSTTISGITRDAFDSYLFLDGKPKALTSLDNTDEGVATQEVMDDGSTIDRLDISNLLEVRDQRLTATTDPYVYYQGFTWARWGAMQMTSSTGYGVRKYDSPNYPVSSRDVSGSNYSSCPLYWISYIYCNLAEAKAELGTLTDADLDNTLNKLYKRANLPTTTVAALSSMNDPANNMNVSSLIWEVRRCRRCELIMDNWIRYWDLVRWHQLDKLDSSKYPLIAQGANVKNAAVKPNLMDGDYMNAFLGQTRLYDAKYYLYPIPSGQLALNPNFKQNPGW